MHFSIPTSSKLTDSQDKTYTAYNLQINGVHHCSLRYSQLHSFNAQLQNEFSHFILSSFPSKKLLSLSSAQLESRRVDLEKYIQTISQVPEIVSSNYFTVFFLNAQKESMKEVDEEVELQVHVPGASMPLAVSIHSVDRTLHVYQAVAALLNLSDFSRCFFGLFLIHHKTDGHSTIIRRFQGFESPYISLKSSRVKSGKVLIAIRKIYWDIEYDKELLNDRTSLNILAALAKNDLENGWVRCGDEEKEKLQRLFKQGLKKEYMRRMWQVPYYANILSDKCFTDFPEPDTAVVVCVGGAEVRFLHEARSTELKFKVTRIRSWRIASITKEKCTDSVSSLGSEALELSLEYLVSKDSLRWISICSKQAILISMCLQSIVDELIMRKKGLQLGKTTASDTSSVPQNKLSCSRLNEMDFEKPTNVTKNDAFDEIKDDDL